MVAVVKLWQEIVGGGTGIRRWRGECCDRKEVVTEIRRQGGRRGGPVAIVDFGPQPREGRKWV